MKKVKKYYFCRTQVEENVSSLEFEIIRVANF